MQFFKVYFYFHLKVTFWQRKIRLFKGVVQEHWTVSCMGTPARQMNIAGPAIQGSFTCIICLIWAKKLLKSQNCNIAVNFKEIEKLGEKEDLTRARFCQFYWAKTKTYQADNKQNSGSEGALIQDTILKSSLHWHCTSSKSPCGFFIYML